MDFGRLIHWLDGNAAARKPSTPPKLQLVKPARKAADNRSAVDPIAIDQDLWDSMLRRPHLKEVPAGMRDRSSLDQLLDQDYTFTGLVIAVSVHQSDGRSVSADALRPVTALIRDSLRRGEFACPLSLDEFLILSPDLRGAEAHKRAADFAERLWDFQLRATAPQPVMFNWGDAQACDELLSDAIALASERMQQSRRTRKRASTNFSPRSRFFG